MLRELRVPVASSTVAWADVPAVICGDFAGVREGLYAFNFSNDSDLHVYDNNTKKKIVVHGHGASVKPGKFEQGLGVRINNYNAHLHRTHANGSHEWVLHQCFRTGYLLDLSDLVDAVRAPARIFERYWTEAVNAFLNEYRVLADQPVKQLGRAEWRYVQRERWTESVQLDFREYLERVAERVFAMAQVGGFSTLKAQK